MYFFLPPCCGRTENCAFHCNPKFVKFFSEEFHIILIKAILWSNDLSKGPESGKALKTRPVCKVVVSDGGPCPSKSPSGIVVQTGSPAVWGGNARA